MYLRSLFFVFSIPLVNKAQKERIDREDSSIQRKAIQKMAHTEVNFINLTTLDFIDFRR